jgi:hypothetical protein
VKFLDARSLGLLLATFLFATGCVTVAKTAGRGGVKVGTKAAASTTKAVVKVPASIISDDRDKASEPDAK